MKNASTVMNAGTMELYYELACQWEEEPEIADPWQRNMDI